MWTSATWGPDETIILGGYSGGLYRVPAAGGTPEVLAVPDSGSGEIWVAPTVIPGTRMLLFLVRKGVTFTQSSIAMLDMETGTHKILLEDGAPFMHVSDGRLFFSGDGQVMAVPFDPEHMAVTGAPSPVRQNIAMYNIFAAFRIAGDGTLAYVSGTASTPLRQLVWVDREGLSTPFSPDRREFRYPRISPDGSRVAVRITEDNETHIGVYNVASGRADRLTFEGAYNTTPQWTPDGSRVTFASDRAGGRDIYWKPADGSGPATSLWTGELNQYPYAWSPDGRVLVFEEQNSTTASDLWALHLPDSTAVPVVVAPGVQLSATFSPDGRWLAYMSNETGRYDIWVQPWPPTGGKWLGSAGGGTQPR